MKIRLCDINMIHSNGIKVQKPFGFGDYLFLRLKTPARFYVDGIWHEAATDDIILYKAGSPQYYESLDNSVYCDDFIFFNTENDIDLNFMEGLSLKFNQLVHIPDLRQFMSIHEMLYMEFINQDEFSKEIIDSLLKVFLIKLNKSMNSDSVLCNHSLFETLNLLRLDIYNTPSKKWTVSDMADYVNLSPSYFQSIYKKTFHISCMADLFASRMNLAKTLLVTTNLSMHEIAQNCGYDSAIYFSRHFKKKTGMTPSQYRNDSK